MGSDLERSRNINKVQTDSTVELYWGFTATDSYKDYYKRIDSNIEYCHTHKKSIPNTALEIFEDITANYHHSRFKDEIYPILRQMVGREPTIDDLNILIDYIKNRVFKRIEMNTKLIN